VAEQLEAWTRRLRAGLRRLPGDVERRLRRARKRAAAHARARAPKDTGGLARSIQAEHGRRGSPLSGGLMSDHPGAEVQDQGARLTGSPWLAIPLVPAAEELPGPRSDTDLISIRGRDGRLYLASRRGSGIEIRWALRRRATLRGTGYLTRAFQRYQRDLESESMDAMREHLGPRGLP